jgi:hypothetical protein
MIDIAQEMTGVTFNIVAKSLFSSDVEMHTLHKLSSYFNDIQSFMARMSIRSKRDGNQGLVW